MKKIALCLLFVGMNVSAAHAGIVKGADCLREFRMGNNNWFARSNEYLFPTEEDYLKVINRGTVYECDNSECGNNTYVEMPAGHYFDGLYRDYAATYKCNIGGNDSWEKVDNVDGLRKCTKSYEKWGSIGANSDEYLYPTKADYDAVKKNEYGKVYECDSNVCRQGTEITLDSVHYFGKEKITETKRYVCITKGGGDYWQPMDTLCGDDDCDKKKKVVTPEEQDCINAAKRGEPANWNNNNCNCGDRMVWNKTAKRCEDKKGSSCEELFPTRNAEGLACCRAGKATTWSDSEKKCTCVDTTKKWTWTSPDKYGKCVAQGGPVIPDTPVVPGIEPTPQQECTVYTRTEVRCANGNYYKANIPVSITTTQEQCEIMQTLSNPDFLQYLETLICGNPDRYTYYLKIDEQQLSSAQSAISNLNSFFENEKVSVWKDKDGEFNKARLASDLTAGVVLGTVGGVVSGVVIKKKQVEKGFDALHCTVGGQTVADWGDEFRVGLKQ